MKWILCALLAFAIGELIALLVFDRLRVIYGPRLLPEGKGHTSRHAIFKGVLERLVVYLGLLMDYAVIIAAFGAFKLGTRLKEDQNAAVSNDYFLVGNLVSLLIVLVEVLLFRGMLRLFS